VTPAHAPAILCSELKTTYPGYCVGCMNGPGVRRSTNTDGRSTLGETEERLFVAFATVTSRRYNDTISIEHLYQTGDFTHDRQYTGSPRTVSLYTCVGRHPWHVRRHTSRRLCTARHASTRRHHTRRSKCDTRRTGQPQRGCATSKQAIGHATIVSLRTARRPCFCDSLVTLRKSAVFLLPASGGAVALLSMTARISPQAD
jgi:hypothetical protein